MKNGNSDEIGYQFKCCTITAMTPWTTYLYEIMSTYCNFSSFRLPVVLLNDILETQCYMQARSDATEPPVESQLSGCSDEVTNNVCRVQKRLLQGV
jgi:hypothetical protein